MTAGGVSVEDVIATQLLLGDLPFVIPRQLGITKERLLLRDFNSRKAF
jgi:hypothetical protein